jgi:hypothetical protein
MACSGLLADVGLAIPKVGLAIRQALRPNEVPRCVASVSADKEIASIAKGPIEVAHHCWPLEGEHHNG